MGTGGGWGDDFGAGEYQKLHLANIVVFRTDRPRMMFVEAEKIDSLCMIVLGVGDFRRQVSSLVFFTPNRSLQSLKESFELFLTCPFSVFFLGISFF